MTQFSAHFQKDAAFGEAVRKRVFEYMKENDLSKRANAGMISKTLLFFGWYVTIFLGLLWNPFHSLVWMFLSYGSLGILLGTIGMNIMHDKVHGAYAESPVWNFLLEIPIFLIGLESSIWYIEHNVLHHNFTNVEGMDHDIHHRFVFRFSENQPKRWFHRFQHVYAPFIYGMLLFEWLTVKDFVKVIQYRKRNLIHSDKEAFRLFIQILIKKTAFHAIFLGIPLLVLSFNSSWIIVAYASMLVCGGFFMTMVFQLAHIVPDVRFIPNDQENIEENWFVYQLQTTSNFANHHSLVTKIIGGLNYQIEHHLFPTICHVNYPQIAPIVKKTAEEFAVPYYCLPTVGSAIRAHFRLLKSLGN
jgi:linoleoyl-CoA desaturase